MNWQRPGRGVAGLLLLALALLLVALSSYGQMRRSQRSAQEAVAALEDCRRLTASIRQLRQRPARAGTQKLEQAELSRLLESAASAAGMPPDALGRIAPEPPRRVGNSAYMEQLTPVQLRGVSLRQLVTFLHGACAGDADLHARSLRLSAPRDAHAGALWNAEVVVNYLIFAPPTQAHAAAR